jgi:hypothetical protein
MKIRTIVLLALSSLLVACSTTSTMTPQATTGTPVGNATRTSSPSQTSTSTAKPTPSFTPTSTPTSIPTPEINLALERISQLGGSISGITIVGDVAYVGMGPRVAGIDISDHQDPKLISQSEPLPGLVTLLVQVSKGPAQFLAVSAGKYVVVINTSNPDGPKSVHQLELPGAISAMVWDPNAAMLYVGGSVYEAAYEYSGFIAALDITLDNRLKLMDSISLPEQPNSIALAEGGLFTGSDANTGGLYHIQLETPSEFSTPHLVIPSSLENGFAVYSLQVVGNYLFVGANMDLQAYDITNADQPVQVWKEFIGFLPKSFILNGSQVYVFGWVPAGAYIPTSTKLTPPESVADSILGSVASIIAAYHDDFVIAFHDFEIKSSTDLELLGSYQPPVISILGSAADDHTIYVVDAGVVDSRDNVTLRLFSLPDLTPLGQVQTDIPSSSGWFSGIAIEGNRAYLASADNLYVYDISSDTPTLLAKPYIVNGQMDAIAAVQINGKRVLFTAEYSSLLGIITAYDMSDLQKPLKIGSSLTLETGIIHQLTWQDSRLYAILEGESDRLFVINFENNTLVQQGTLKLPGSIFSMAVDEGVAVMAGTEGMSIASVVDAQSPQIEAEAALPELGTGVAMLKDTALVIAGGNNGAAQLLAFDIQDPRNPRQVTSMDVAFNPSLIGPIAVSNPYIILAKGSAGVEVLQFQIQK